VLPIRLSRVGGQPHAPLVQGVRHRDQDAERTDRKSFAWSRPGSPRRWSARLLRRQVGCTHIDPVIQRLGQFRDARARGLGIADCRSALGKRWRQTPRPCARCRSSACGACPGPWSESGCGASVSLGFGAGFGAGWGGLTIAGLFHRPCDGLVAHRLRPDATRRRAGCVRSRSSSERETRCHWPCRRCRRQKPPGDGCALHTQQRERVCGVHGGGVHVGRLVLALNHAKPASPMVALSPKALLLSSALVA